MGGDVDRIDLAQDMSKLRAFVNGWLSFGFHKMRETSLIAEKL